MQQAWLFGAPILADRPTRLGRNRLVRLSDGAEMATRAVILAMGVAWRRLGVPALGAERGRRLLRVHRQRGQGLRGEDVFVVGAGNSARRPSTSAYAASVTIVTIDERLGEFMSDYLVRKVEATPNIAVLLHTEVVDGHGRQRLEA